MLYLSDGNTISYDDYCRLIRLLVRSRNPEASPYSLLFLNGCETATGDSDLTFRREALREHDLRSDSDRIGRAQNVRGEVRLPFPARDVQRREIDRRSDPRAAARSRHVAREFALRLLCATPTIASRRPRRPRSPDSSSSAGIRHERQIVELAERTPTKGSPTIRRAIGCCSRVATTTSTRASIGSRRRKRGFCFCTGKPVAANPRSCARVSFESRGSELRYLFLRDETDSPIFIRCGADPVARIAEELFHFASRPLAVHDVLGERQQDLTGALQGRDLAAFVAACRMPGALSASLRALSSVIPRTLVIVLDQAEEVITLNEDCYHNRDSFRRREDFFGFFNEFSTINFRSSSSSRCARIIPANSSSSHRWAAASTCARHARRPPTRIRAMRKMCCPQSGPTSSCFCCRSCGPRRFCRRSSCRRRRPPMPNPAWPRLSSNTDSRTRPASRDHRARPVPGVVDRGASGHADRMSRAIPRGDQPARRARHRSGVVREARRHPGTGRSPYFEIAATELPRRRAAQPACGRRRCVARSARPIRSARIGWQRTHAHR